MVMNCTVPSHLLVRSPMFTKFVSGRMVKGSRPLNREYGSGWDSMCGLRSRTDSLIARVVEEPPKPA